MQGVRICASLNGGTNILKFYKRKASSSVLGRYFKVWVALECNSSSIEMASSRNHINLYN